MENGVDSDYRLIVPEDVDLRVLYGINNSFVKYVRERLNADFWVNERVISGNGKEFEAVRAVFEELIELAKSGYSPREADLRYIVSLSSRGERPGLNKLMKKRIVITAKNKVINPKTLHQKEYVDAIDKYDVVFGIGPAGTGKTYLAVAKAVDLFNSKAVERIILVRPAVEAGEKLGFLPGDMQQKVDPFLRPLYDALFEMMSPAKVEALLGKGIIEIIPLAYMRGRTLNDAFIIMDEAQNSTPEQMKMFLTRTGFGSKVVVTGDITQIDLPGEKKSGLVNAEQVLSPIKEIAFVYFSHVDVVRHKLVQDIIKAYQDEEK